MLRCDPKFKSGAAVGSSDLLGDGNILCLVFCYATQSLNIQIKVYGFRALLTSWMLLIKKLSVILIIINKNMATLSNKHIQTQQIMSCIVPSADSENAVGNLLYFPIFQTVLDALWISDALKIK